MKLSELAGGIPPGVSADIEIAGITADSRAVEPGYLFAALPGTEVDGAQFIPAAIAAGAVAVLAAPDAPVPDGVAVIRDPAPRRRLARMAANVFPRQPETLVAVTGTNGKTSVASFLYQIWCAQGFSAASIGTLGVHVSGETRPLRHTTPEPVELHRILDGLAGESVSHAALEASSHGLAQHRLDGARLSAAAFTNISRDHLDYHPDFESYFAAKMRLFEEVLPEGAPAVIDIDRPEGARVAELAKARGRHVWTVGHEGEAIRVSDPRPEGFGQRVEFVFDGTAYSLMLPLAGSFQVSNAAIAAGLALATGNAPEDVFPALETLEGARGRMELAGHAPSGGGIFIDYAHTPDALESALRALRPFAVGQVAVVFGCGGERDTGKRAEMGAIAQQLAERVYVTDDNPRGEDPAMIRQAIMRAASGARDIPDRREAIAAAIAELGRDDVLLIAGKGHETGQIVKGHTYPFSDLEAVREVLDGYARAETPLV
ncbi:MAG: UDP-N-acetylmuramoyl-L-alanyl-D-glutamate--2,6-diaminopimelate ligase [Alphaproteobacteria bacterium]|jgi:UDP-N-acetylmuramoyl-L-alanyl-D-glutamate--2,6-diaminopimelate ligase|nr:UDP-N-acetylmuramoyl-L-alanyl-D-glutamate--2,6-diaminopimelate ligase [Alphaproteobacteria bacterium]